MNTFSYKYIKALLSLTITFTIICGSIFSGVIGVLGANYGEADSDSFVFYKQKIESSLQDLEREFRVNNGVTDSSLGNIRNLIQEAYIRLPDSGDNASKNEGLKKSVDLYLDLAAKNKTSSTHVSNAASQATKFLAEASIGQITGSIVANPSSGNAPLISSFLATAKDPSGVNIPDKNFIWWMREGGGYRRELGRGPSLTYTFAKEGNYQIFLDVISESRNKKGKTDVTPLSISQDIEVKPRLGNVILLVNGVNVSNLDTLKVSPTLGKIGLLFDATASRAVSNGTIVKTKWDFGNGNTLEYDGSPVVERQLYVNPGMYKITIDITTNQNQTFQKQLQLLVRDPAAVIVLDKEVGYIGEDINMSANSYLSNTNNVEYSWQVQDSYASEKPVATQAGNVFKFKPKKVGQYLVTLTSRSPNGNTDSDTRFITIESRPPIINLDTPRSINPEKPNTVLFDASRTYDPDTKSTSDLTYTWIIDGQEVALSDSAKGGSMGTYYFDEKGQHTISLTVTNAFGKVTTIDKTFEVASTLTVGMNISPRAAPIGSLISFQARSPQARFYEWNAGDGSPTVNGTSDFIQHIYKKTGVYSATLTVKNGDGSEENRITRKVYITDTDSPFALIDVKNTNGSAYEDPTACDAPDGAFVINRAEGTTIDGGNSINVDGNSTGLSYTWKYLDRIKTGPLLTEKFTELGCFPIELTVKSEKNGMKHTSTRFIQIKNIVPKLTSVDATIDATKKDTQKILVNVTANGARDDDGVITAYIWFYTTESDPERQNVRITQSPTTTFILPNVTEKYYFGVIIEDNDGARIDSSEDIKDQSPLLIANDEANINMPLISLNVDKTQALTDEPLRFSASAKNILGADITAKSEYYWDFEGDGRIDQKTSEPQVSYTYKKSGKYNMKLKVTNNGTSNTKYQLIYIKNELKANATGYRIGDMLYFLNTSRGTYDSATWTFGGEKYESLHGVRIASSKIGTGALIGNLTIKSGVNEVSSIDITGGLISDGTAGMSGILIQSFPKLIDDTITIASPGEKLILSAYGNTAKEYIIDTDTKIDSDLDGIGNNDKDNQNSASYTDGSAYAIGDISDVKTRNREMKIILIGEDGSIQGSKIIKVVFEYIKDTSRDETKDITGSGSESFGESDKINLEKLQSKIRTLSSEDRIIFTQYYNTLIENWSDLNDRTEGLLNLQKEVNESVTLDTASKDELSRIIDVILVGDAQATNEISVASHVIEGLISTDSPNRGYIIERLEQIKSHPASLAENKILGKEILEKIQEDSSLSTENKILIKSQLLTIINGGQENVTDDEKESLVEESVTGGGMLGFISGIMKVFGIIVGVIIILFLLGYVFYRLSRKSGDMGFQDFLIDSVAHNKSPTPSSAPITVVSTPKTPSIEETIIMPSEPPAINTHAVSDSSSLIVPTPTLVDTSLTAVQSDPLGAWTPPKQSELIMTPSEETIPEASMTPADAPLIREELHVIPDWLKPMTTESPEESPESVDTEIDVSSTEQSEGSTTPDTPNTLMGSASDESTQDDTPLTPVVEEDILEENTPIVSEDPLVPTESRETYDPLIQAEKMEDDPLVSASSDISAETSSDASGEDVDEDIIPDWLKPLDTSPKKQEEKIPEREANDVYEPPKVIVPPPPDTDLPEWLKNSVDTKIEEKTTKSKKTPRSKLSSPKSNSEKKTIKTPKSVSPGEKPNTLNNVPDWLK